VVVQSAGYHCAMSEMIPYSIEPAFTKAIADSLPAGEILGAVSDAFFCSWENYWAKDLFGNDVQRRRDWVSGTTTVAITNVAVRLIGFKTAQVLSPEQEIKKKAFLEKGHSEEKATKKAIGLFGKPLTVPIPELASQTSYQISDVSAINYQETVPANFVVQHFGQHIGEIGILSFSCRSESLTINSLYNNFIDIYRNLEAAKSGAAIASTITTVEASLSRLKSLFDEGVITGEEFDKAKSAFVGKAADVPESAASSLRALNGLFLSGVLTEAEYKAKKFDVLAKSHL